MRENYTCVSNNKFEAVLKYRCSLIQKDIIWTIVRLTDGYSREDSEIAINLIVKLTGHSKSHVHNAVKELINKKVIVITQEADFRNARRGKLNSNFSEWSQEGKQETAAEVIKPIVVFNETKTPVLTPITPEIRSRPEVEDVVNFFAENGYTRLQAERFYYFYDKNDWETTDFNGNKRPIRNWKSKAKEVMLNPKKFNYIIEDENGNETKTKNTTGIRGNFSSGKGAIDADKFKQALKHINIGSGQ